MNWTLVIEIAVAVAIAPFIPWLLLGAVWVLFLPLRGLAWLDGKLRF